MDGSAETGHERLSRSMCRRLVDLGETVPPCEIGDLWVFPPLDEPRGTEEFVLFTRMGENGDRRVYSSRVPPSEEERRELPGPSGYTPERRREMANRREGDEAGGGPEGPDQRVTEHGSMPEGRLAGLIQRFRRRLEDDRAPLHLRIDGSRERWTRLVRPASRNGDGAGDHDTPRSDGDGARSTDAG